MSVGQKPIQVVPIQAPDPSQRVRREARFTAEGEKKTRYSLPDGLKSNSVVGYRTRVSMTQEEAAEALQLLSMERPTGFGPVERITDQELFDESSLGLLIARQSTNYRGHRQVTLGPDDSARVAGLLRELKHGRADVLDGAAYHHIVLSRPYRTPFTLLLTFIGHKAVKSLLTVPYRAYRKKVHHDDDIPTIGYLQHLHLGILADQLERAVVIASEGRRRAQVHVAPFSNAERLADNSGPLGELYHLCGVSRAERRAGWRIALVAQVGTALPSEAVQLRPQTCRKLGANLVAFRSERIQPGVNQEDKAPPQYHERQDMDVPTELTVQCGRAAYNAFAHWTGCDRERSKDLLLQERIDVLTPNGKTRIREVREHLGYVTDEVVRTLPKWVDLPTGKVFSKNANRTRKAFALAGQRIYIAGLSRKEMEAEGLDWQLCIRAVGAAAARSALVAEIMGVTDLPDDCDLLAGICLMAGPVNQNDIGKQWYGSDDLLAHAFPDRDPTSLLVWTLKAKTVADPIGNEEQLLNAKRKGALVDLRPGPHDVIQIRKQGILSPFRSQDGVVSSERAYADLGNFVTDPDGQPIPGNAGEAWAWGDQTIW